MAVTGNHRKLSREGETAQRDALMAAALPGIAEGGGRAAALRAVARRAGLTPGLIRYCFQSGQDLTRAACGRLVDRMMAANLKGLDTSPVDPAARLAAFVAALLRPPVIDAEAPGLWAGFIHRLRIDPQIRLAHEAACLACRDRLRQMGAALPRPAGDATLRAPAVAIAIACNAVIDGPWLHAPALPAAFAAGEIPRIGLTPVGAIVNPDLLSHLPEAP